MWDGRCLRSLTIGCSRDLRWPLSSGQSLSILVPVGARAYQLAPNAFTPSPVVARLRVAHEVIQRVALVGDLGRAIGPGRGRQQGRGRAASGLWRPGGGAGTARHHHAD
jgi:hypothetical protein